MRNKSNNTSSIIFSGSLMVAGIGFGLWTVTHEKASPPVNLQVEAGMINKLIPRAKSETEGQYTGLNEAVSEVNSAKLEDFRSWSEQVLAELPKKEDVQRDSSFSGEGTPKALDKGAAQVAELYDYVTKNPSVKPAAVEAFKDCASNQEGMDAIRAYCYAKAVRIGVELGGEFWNPSTVSNSIKNLSRDL